MKTEIVTMAALLAAVLALPSQARAPQERAPQQQPATSLILAQARGDATCELDGRRVPQGATVCQQGQTMRCTARGSWEKSGKPC